MKDITIHRAFVLAANTYIAILGYAYEKSGTTDRDEWDGSLQEIATRRKRQTEKFGDEITKRIEKNNDVLDAVGDALVLGGMAYTVRDKLVTPEQVVNDFGGILAMLDGLPRD